MEGKLYIAVPETAPYDPNRIVPTMAELRRDLIAAAVSPALSAAGIAKFIGDAKVAAHFRAGDTRMRNLVRLASDAGSERNFRHIQAKVGAETAGVLGSAAVFDCVDLASAERLVHAEAKKVGHAGTYATQLVKNVATTSGKFATDVEMVGYKSIEIYYDVAEIPRSVTPLEFREAACAVIEQALIDAEAGQWEGSETGRGEVNFGFEVQDLERAVKIVRAAVKGTPFERIREITRYSDTEGAKAA